ncbi:MAG: hypothetical protein M3153_07720 [Chloroflexota bacterium]|nr:hypothetical protein [Chloroflexota bacterium]
MTDRLARVTPHTTVDGRPAFLAEKTVAEEGFEPAGTRHDDPCIEIGPDAWLSAGTSDAPNFVRDYEEDKVVLDAMMDSLRFRAASLHSIGAAGPGRCAGDDPAGPPGDRSPVVTTSGLT